MKQPNFTNLEDASSYQKGFKAGYNEGMRKAILTLQLLVNSTENFVDGIIQNCPEAKELRKLMTGSEDKTL